MMVSTPEASGSAATLSTEVSTCILCGFIYNEADGMPEMGIPPGTRWADVPHDFICPDCSGTKADFEMIDI